MITENIKVNKARCRACNTTVESRHTHDYVPCNCGAIAVDGGKQYLRRSFQNMDYIEELSEYYTEEEWAIELKWRASSKYKELLEQRQHYLMVAWSNSNG